MQHIDDLKIEDFIEGVKRLKDSKITEKLDGTNLAFGIDEGRFFTTRELKSKNAPRFFDADDYPMYGGYNFMRIAHLALEQKLDTIKKHIEEGQLIQCEILIGEQPNTVFYGEGAKNKIAFIDNSEVGKKISAELDDQVVAVTCKQVFSSNGHDVEERDDRFDVEFSKPQELKLDLAMYDEAMKVIGELEHFLKAASDVEGLSNEDVLKSRDADAKTAVLATINAEYLQKAKGLIQVALRDKHDKEVDSLSAEGAVVSDDSLGLLKIVDKAQFTSINQFNHSVRSAISSPIRRLDVSAPLEARGGIVGTMRIRIATAFGVPEFAKPRELKRLAGEDGIEQLAKYISGRDIKKQIIEACDDAASELDALIATFVEAVKSDDQFVLKLANGKVITISQTIIDRTLLTAAEAHKSIEVLLQSIDSANSDVELLSVIYGGKFKEAADEQVNEEVDLFEARDYAAKTKYAQVPSSWALLNSYLAILCMSIVIYKSHDVGGIRILKDKAHWRMGKWTTTMSPLNFWGLPIWKSGSPFTAKLMSKKVRSETFKVARHIPQAWYQNMHMDLSYGKDEPIVWEDHKRTMFRFMQYAQVLKTERTMHMLTSAFAYDTLTFDEKSKYLPKLFYYGQQFVSTSPLVARMRVIMQDLLLGDETPLETSPGQDMIAEDDSSNIPASVVPSSSTVNATTSGNVEFTPRKICGIDTVLRRRNPKVKFKKFDKNGDKK